VDIVGPSRRDALAHFVTYLSRCERWILVFDSQNHRTISRDLGDAVSVIARLDLRSLRPEDVSRLDDEYRHSEDVGVITFLVSDARSTRDAAALRAAQRALRPFDKWPTSRVRICFDVADSNFDGLFAEEASEVFRRCQEMCTRLGSGGDLWFESSGGSTLAISPGEWVTYTGLEDYDTPLPSGEVACAPKTVAGRVVFGGWVVGALPFGQKFGRIYPGDLHLEIADATIQSIGGNHRALCDDLDRVFSAEPGLTKIAEVGIGLSLAVSREARRHRVGYQWHERHMGLHLGCGAELVETLQGNRSTNYHIDFVFDGGRLSFRDGEELFEWGDATVGKMNTAEPLLTSMKFS